MAEMNARGVYKARKTPTKVPPSFPPPNLSPSIEVLYHLVTRQTLDAIESGFRDKIVTSQLVYKPAILAVARINFHGNRWGIHFEKDFSRVVLFPSKHQICDWEANLHPQWDQHNCRSNPEADALFLYDPAYDFSMERFDELQEDFRQHLTATVALTVEYNPRFKLERQLDESPESFTARCMERARAEFDQESQNLEDTMNRLQDRLKQRLDREMLGFNNEQQDETERHDTNAAISQIKKEMEALQQLRKTKMDGLEQNISILAGEREKDVLRIKHGHLAILRFALMWLPYTEYVIQEADSRRLELVQSF